MAKLTATNGFYGHSSNKKYTNSAANHLYVGKSPSTSNYRSRMVFPSLRAAQNIGDSRIVVTKAVLYLYRNEGGPTKIYAGCSGSSAWGAILSGYGGGDIAASTGWKSIDVTACAEAIAGYTGNWYMHMLADPGHRIRFDGTSSSHKPYIDITWEYVAATIKGDKEFVTLGEEIVFTITPEVEGETHTLTYSIGGSEGVIAENVGDTVSFTPPVELASEITDDSDGTINVFMTAYDADGNVLRTERYPLKVMVPVTLAAKFDQIGAELVGGLSGYALTGRSSAVIAPVIDVDETYGAEVKSVTARVVNGDREETIIWTEFAETEPGLFACAAAQTHVFDTAGDATVYLSVEDSRGLAKAARAKWEVCEYTPPMIETFTAQRYGPVYDDNEEEVGEAPDDLGNRVWVGVKASVATIVRDLEQLNILTWEIDAVNPATGETLEDSGTGNQSIEFLKKLQDVVSEGDTWNYTLTITDSAGESAVQYASVQPGWVNFALAACKRGAAFGGIPNATKEHPMLESWYPIYAYAGICGVNRYQEGEVETGDVWFGKKIFRQIITCSAPAGTTTSIGTIADIETVVELRGMATMNDTLTRVPLSYSYNGDDVVVGVMADGTVYVNCYKACTAFVIVDYTKKEVTD